MELFDSIINTSQDCVFWKDKERRFLGVNQAFLDYYGFESADVLIGKTDEDMGWHSDPEPFKQDELRVLSGRSTYKVQGKCMMRGMERDIIASKRPLYEDGRIIGLVGSFVDVTDVIRRKHGMDNGQVVYTIETLRRYRFFDRLIDGISLEEILDPLTGVLSRGYSVKFVRSLIEQKIPFTFAIFDLDNFKFINDRYGHGAGDQVLKSVSAGLAEAVKDSGLIGRFGGDELLLIDLKNTKKEEKKELFERLYSDPRALRMTVEFENGSAFVTGTAGAASFPEDAGDYTELFELIDKMLYLGKRRGRNCYTVYEEEEHRNVEIARIATNSIFIDMQEIRQDTENVSGAEERLKAVAPRIAEILKIPELYYVTEERRLRSAMTPTVDEAADDITELMREDVFSDGSLEDVRKKSPILGNSLERLGAASILIIRVRKKNGGDAYLVCAAERSFRIWQENECAILYYLAGLLEKE